MLTTAGTLAGAAVVMTSVPAAARAVTVQGMTGMTGPTGPTGPAGAGATTAAIFVHRFSEHDGSTAIGRGGGDGQLLTARIFCPTGAIAIGAFATPPPDSAWVVTDSYALPESSPGPQGWRLRLESTDLTTLRAEDTYVLCAPLPAA